MKLRLLITRRETKRHNTTIKVKHLFAVIDLDKSKKYPQNFVSVLPKSIKAGDKPSNKFEELFGNESLKMANQLLEKALKARPDSETTQAITERLKLLSPQLRNKAKCENCGKPLNQTKRKFIPYKFCFECHSEGYT